MAIKNETSWLKKNWWQLLLLTVMVIGWVWNAAQASRDLNDLKEDKASKSDFIMHCVITEDRISRLEKSVETLVALQTESNKVTVRHSTLLEQLIRKL